MSMDGGARVGVDLSSARVRAVAGWPDGTAMVLPLGGVGWLANPVVVAADGPLRVGVPAGPAEGGAADPGVLPGRAEVVPAGQWVGGTDLLTALVREVLSCAETVTGGRVCGVTVAVPAGWGPRRLAALREAVLRAGGGPVLVSAPVAVGWHLLAGGLTLPAGSLLLVCEVDAACSATVLRRTAVGFDALSDVDTATVAADLGATDGPPVGQPHGSAALTSPDGDAAAPATPAGDVRRAEARTGEVVRRAVDGAGVGCGDLILVGVVGTGAADPSVGAEIRDAAGVEPFVVAEAELAVALGTLRVPPPPSGSADRPASESAGRPEPDGRRGTAVGAGWWDVAAVVVPAVWSVVLFWQFMAGSERYGPRQSIDAAMLLAAWGGLAFAATFGLIAAVGGLMLSTAVRHVEGDAPAWVRHRLLAAALAGGGVAGLVVAAVYATVAAGYFELESGPLLRWSVLPVVPGVVAVVGLAVVVWRRPDPPQGSWLGWLRFPPPVAALVGFGAWLISYDEQGSPVLLNVLAWQLRQWLVESPTAIIGSVGRLGGLCVGVGMGLLLVRRPLHRLLLAVPLAAVIAGSLAWRTTGMVAVGFSFAVAGWWAARMVWVLLRPLLLVPPAGSGAPSASFPAAPGSAASAGPGWPEQPVAVPHGGGEGSRWAG